MDVPDVDARAIARAADALVRGGLVGLPTETVYGLAADADNGAAVAGIFQAKGRPADHPLIVHVVAAGAATAWARVIPDEARALMQHFWPGPLTVILPRSARALDAVTGGQDTVGLRCPAHPWAQALLRAFGVRRADPAAGLAAPSANRYGRISPTCARHVREDLGERPQGLVDVVLDGGDCSLGIESTIVDFAAGHARVLRPGSIAAADLARVLGRPVSLAADTEDAPRVSGRVAAHYAPRKPLELVAPERLAARVAQLRGRPTAVLARAADLEALAPDPALVRRVAPDGPAAYAHDLYENLRSLDATAAERLLVAVPGEGAPWTAVLDRLQRAAAGGGTGLSEAD